MPNRLFRWANFLPPTPTGVTFKSIFSGDCTSYAIDSNNYGWATGLGTSGQLGDGSTVSKCVWVKICCDYQYCKIDASANHAIAIKTDGTAVAWGNNTCGKLGDGSITARCQPVAVCCNYCYLDVSACLNQSNGVKSTDCLAVSWGNNGAGQLGDGTITSKCQPVAVCCNYTYQKLTVSSFHAMGVKTDGCAVGWGCNNCGQLGDGSITARCQPVAVCCNYQYCCIIAASGSAASTMALKTDGTAVSWGNNPNGSLGDNTTAAKCQPIAVCCNYTYCKICMGFNHVAAIKTDGLAVSWGSGSNGTLGDGSTLQKNQPVAICCNYCYCDISAALTYSMAIRRDGVAFAWGNNAVGQLGTGNTTCYCIPTQVCSLTV